MYRGLYVLKKYGKGAISLDHLEWRKRIWDLTAMLKNKQSDRGADLSYLITRVDARWDSLIFLSCDAHTPSTSQHCLSLSIFIFEHLTPISLHYRIPCFDSNLPDDRSPDTSLLFSSYRTSNCVVFLILDSSLTGCSIVPFPSCSMKSSLLLSPPITDASWLLPWPRSAVPGIHSFFPLPAYLNAFVFREVELLGKSLGNTLASGWRHIGRQAHIWMMLVFVSFLLVTSMLTIAILSSSIVHIVARTSPVACQLWIILVQILFSWVSHTSWIWTRRGRVQSCHAQDTCDNDAMCVSLHVSVTYSETTHKIPSANTMTKDSFWLSWSFSPIISGIGNDKMMTIQISWNTQTIFIQPSPNSVLVIQQVQRRHTISQYTDDSIGIPKLDCFNTCSRDQFVICSWNWGALE